MAAAEDSGDFDLYQRLVMDRSTGGGGLWVHDKSWQKVDLPTNAVPVEMLSLRKNGRLVAFDAGFVARTDDAASFEYSNEIDTKTFGELASMIEHDGGVVCATELALFQLDFPEFSAFVPEVPKTVVGIVAIRSAGSTLWLFDDEGSIG